jgi:hypothetical protein
MWLTVKPNVANFISSIGCPADICNILPLLLVDPLLRRIHHHTPRASLDERDCSGFYDSRRIGSANYHSTASDGLPTHASTITIKRKSGATSQAGREI